MITAELVITTQGWRDANTHVVRFSSNEGAEAKFNEISALLKRRGNKENDLPKWLEIEGVNKLICDFDSVFAISYVDFKKANEHEIGMKDQYPHLFRGK